MRATNDLKYWQSELEHCQKMLNLAIESRDIEGAKIWQNEVEECTKWVNACNVPGMDNPKDDDQYSKWVQEK